MLRKKVMTVVAGVGLLMLSSCDSRSPAERTVTSSALLSSAASGPGGPSFWTGTIDGGGSWKFGTPQARTTALTIHGTGVRMVSRDCPADIICGGIWGSSGSSFINITVMEQYVANNSPTFVFSVAWGDSQTFEAVILDDLNQWWSFMDSQAGVSTPIVVQNIRNFIAARDGVIRGTTRQVVLR